MMEGLIDATARAERDEGIRCVVIRGAGENFMAGGDVKTFHKSLTEDRDAYLRRREMQVVAAHQLIYQLRRMPKPFVVSVVGAAVKKRKSLGRAARWIGCGNGKARAKARGRPDRRARACQAPDPLLARSFLGRALAPRGREFRGRRGDAGSSRRRVRFRGEAPAGVPGEISASGPAPQRDSALTPVRFDSDSRWPPSRSKFPGSSQRSNAAWSAGHSRSTIEYQAESRWR